MSTVKIGHIYLSTASDDAASEFALLVEALDRLAVEQHAIVSSAALARRLQSCPYVTVGPVVKSPVVAYCLMPDIDLVHAHDEKSGQAGLLLTQKILTIESRISVSAYPELTTSRKIEKINEINFI